MSGRAGMRCARTREEAQTRERRAPRARAPGLVCSWSQAPSDWRCARTARSSRYSNAHTLQHPLPCARPPSSVRHAELQHNRVHVPVHQNRPTRSTPPRRNETLPPLPPPSASHLVDVLIEVRRDRIKRPEAIRHERAPRVVCIRLWVGRGRGDGQLPEERLAQPRVLRTRERRRRAAKGRQRVRMGRRGAYKRRAGTRNEMHASGAEPATSRPNALADARNAFADARPASARDCQTFGVRPTRRTRGQRACARAEAPFASQCRRLGAPLRAACA